MPGIGLEALLALGMWKQLIYTIFRL